MFERILKKTKFLFTALVCILLCVIGFNVLIVEQDNILRKYFVIKPREHLKELHTSFANSLSKYFVRENRQADLNQVQEYLKKYGKTSLFELFFIFQDKSGSMKQLSNIGLSTITNKILSEENVYPVSVDNGNIEGYLMVEIKEKEGPEIQDGLVKYKIVSYSIRLVFLLLITALLIIVFYHDYSAKMKLARDIAEIKASYDGLTGLHTHEYFMKMLDIEVERANIYNTPLALIMLDIDFFKKFNDQFGHMAGDKVLQEVSKIIKVSTRATDILSRYGGEEYAIIIPYVAKTPESDAAGRLEGFFNEIRNIADRIRKNVEDAAVEVSATSLNVTVSLGVAFYYGKSEILKSAELLSKADKALYESKRQGRNRVSIDYDSPSTRTSSK